MLQSIASLAVFIVSSLNAGQAQDDRPFISTTLCQLAINPASFAGKDVRVIGVFATDHRSLSFFRDDSCPEVSVAFFIDRKSEESELLTFKKDLVGSALKLDASAYKVDAIGTFEFLPEGMPERIILPRRDIGKLSVRRIVSYEKLESYLKRLQ